MFSKDMNKNDPNYPHPMSYGISMIMKGNRSRDTKPEVAIRSRLHRLGYRYRKELSIEADGHKCRPDLVFTKKRVAVFIDGCFWHYCPVHGHLPKTNAHYWHEKLFRNVQRDALNTRTLEASGWKVVRIWEHSTVEEAVDIITQTLSAQPLSPSPSL